MFYFVLLPTSSVSTLLGDLRGRKDSGWLVPSLNCRAPSTGLFLPRPERNVLDLLTFLNVCGELMDGVDSIPDSHPMSSVVSVPVGESKVREVHKQSSQGKRAV